MLDLSYSITADLQESLITIDTLRTAILKAPLAPKTELRLRWEAQAERLAGSLTLSGLPTTSHEVARLLAHPPKRPTHKERTILSYRRASATIAFEWTAYERPISTTIIRTLAGLADPGITLGQSKLALVKQLLDYIQAKEEYPLVPAATACYFFLTDPVLGEDGGRLARLVFYLFLAKYGWDCRGLLELETTWLTSSALYTQAQQEATITHWLEVVALGIVSSLTQTVQQLKNKQLTTSMPAAFFTLSDRQKTILLLLEEPRAQLTNSTIQKHFGVSQITASRDLSKLAHLGLLYAHGQGRTTSYTRA